MAPTPRCAGPCGGPVFAPGHPLCPRCARKLPKRLRARAAHAEAVAWLHGPGRDVAPRPKGPPLGTGVVETATGRRGEMVQTATRWGVKAARVRFFDGETRWIARDELRGE